MGEEISENKRHKAHDFNTRAKLSGKYKDKNGNPISVYEWRENNKEIYNRQRAAMVIIHDYVVSLSQTLEIPLEKAAVLVCRLAKERLGSL